MSMYRTFTRRLMLNYFIGSITAVMGVGGLLVFTTLELSQREYLWLAGVLVISLFSMIGLEWPIFQKQILPIRRAFTEDIKDFHQLQNIYMRLHRLPELTLKRILGPHYFGLAIPAVILTLWLIHIQKVLIPSRYVLVALLGALLVAAMHAMIEFFLTSYAIRPVIEEVRKISKEKFKKELSLEGKVLTSIRRKFRWGAFLIGAFPILLYGLAVQLRTGHLDGSDGSYWQWAGYILVVALGFAFFGAWLLTKDVEIPIQHLYERMAEVKEGNLNAQASELFSDEFSKLVSGFNHMLSSIKAQHELNSQLIESYFATLAAALDARDPYTAGHSLRVAEYAVQIGTLAKLKRDQLDALRKSALLHDIGKIGTRDAVLLKEGKLTEEEFNQIKEHPALGESILRQIEPANAMALFLPGVRSHHERYDGKGYPDQLKGEEIPLFGRIIAVADAFDAMTSNRPYRKGLDKDQAIRILEEGRGTQWDPYFAGLFVEQYYKQSKNITNFAG
ncbi:5'-deoxynucleotidase YfbR-like HD superfamily hydrolase [Paenibacillus shirakamiensis]|uniref:5'-deoxynucleotidase YfbR-like HD superfamily hydrolase n=1 Tax=Paenibacillus shirakamiensis TaxID=1265935 RepID=A0ABS4JIV1_9BACL|nr:HD domain-containing phosphohydrolase [Paenibacillus shirakamiensis]MBP2001630.1 5'-deoxynucleotidase YfbR-like HD superfamily hydrolase [Paenibacillus shirakamiensis]